MGEWKPISSAPKDGSEFLAFDGEANKMDVAHWSKFHSWFEAVQSDGEYGPSTGDFGYRSETITPWMPLPEPPALATKG